MPETRAKYNPELRCYLCPECEAPLREGYIHSPGCSRSQESKFGDLTDWYWSRRLTKIQERATMSRLDNHHPGVNCLRLLGEGYISPSKAMEWLTHYILQDVQDPIAEWPNGFYQGTDDLRSAQELRDALAKSEGECIALRQKLEAQLVNSLIAAGE